MTTRRLVGKFAKPIEAVFASYNLAPGPLDPVPKVMSFEEFLSFQTKDIVHIGSKIVERFEQLFRLYRITRTGDDLCDFRNLALEMAIEQFPDFRLRDDPTLIELLLPLYGIASDEGDAFGYQLLVVRMAKDYFPINKQPYRRKPHNRLALLWLLDDLEMVQLDRKRSRPYLDSEAITKLTTEEPFKTRWGDINAKTLRNWLSAAHKLFDTGMRPRSSLASWRRGSESGRQGGHEGEDRPKASDKILGSDHGLAEDRTSEHPRGHDSDYEK